MKNYIIVNSNSDNACIDLYRFYGNENDMLEKLLYLAKKRLEDGRFKESDIPEDINEIDFSKSYKEWSIILSGYDYSECFVAKEYNDIEMV